MTIKHCKQALSIFYIILGTRIIYDRKFLLDLKASPLSQTPTKLPVIPGVTLDDHGKIIEEDEESLNIANGTIPEEVPKPAREEKKSNGKIIIYFFMGWVTYRFSVRLASF